MTIQNQWKLFLIIVAIISLVSIQTVSASTLSYSIEVSEAVCTALSGKVILRMSGATNAHIHVNAQLQMRNL